jgi:triacylglycerol esterase/lipase EstA (alpha/beta hydrolase family)
MRRAQLVELALYAAIALALHARGWSVGASAAAIPAMALATRLAIVCTMFVLAWIHRAPRAPAERIGLAGTAAMVLREYGAFLVLNFVRTPWERQVLRPDPPEDAPGELPVVLVHGYFANRGCWKPLVAALERAGVGPVYTPNFPAHLATLERFEEELNAAIDRIARGRRVALVAHSMGGLAVRLYLARRGAGRISRIVTIGSPHHGTRLAPWGVGANARQMVPGSGFLRALEAGEGDASNVPAVSIYSVHDNMILPQDSSRLAWARNIPVSGLGHVSQFGDARIARLVIEALRG